MISRSLVKAAVRHAAEGYRSFPPEPFGGKADSAHFGTDNVYLFRDLSRTFVVVLGTEFSFKEWFKNFKVKKRNVQYLGRVHSGFYENVRELWGRLHTFEAFEDPNICFVGHSRGAAIASILAVSYALIYKRPPKLVTFGSPRVGDRAWKQAFDDSGVECVRVVNRWDPVPYVPTIGFVHVGKVCRQKTGRHGIADYDAGLQI